MNGSSRLFHSRLCGSRLAQTPKMIAHDAEEHPGATAPEHRAEQADGGEAR